MDHRHPSNRTTQPPPPGPPRSPNQTNRNPQGNVAHHGVSSPVSPPQNRNVGAAVLPNSGVPTVANNTAMPPPTPPPKTYEPQELPSDLLDKHSKFLEDYKKLYNDISKESFDKQLIVSMQLDQIHTLRDNKAKIRNKYEQTAQKLESSQKQVEVLTQENAKAENNIKLRDAEVQKLKNENQKISTERGQLSKQLNSCKSEVTNQRAKIKQMEKERNDQAAMILKKDEEHKLEVEQLRNETKNIHLKLTDAKKDNADLKLENAELKKKNKELDDRVKEVCDFFVNHFEKGKDAMLAKYRKWFPPQISGNARSDEIRKSDNPATNPESQKPSFKPGVGDSGGAPLMKSQPQLGSSSGPKKINKRPIDCGNESRDLVTDEGPQKKKSSGCSVTHR